MDSRPGYQRGSSNHLAYGGSASNSPALTGAQAARRRKQPPRPADFKLQVIIIGSRGVGKTSLMERFTDDTFCEACKSTVGVDFKIKTVELRGKKIRLQIWDTAGQERFNSITSAYYRSAKGIILVYDITKKETFEDLPKWMKMIDKYASEEAELLLVGNKLDCETDREITRQQGEKVKFYMFSIKKFMILPLSVIKGATTLSILMGGELFFFCFYLVGELCFRAQHRHFYAVLLMSCFLVCTTDNWDAIL
ncbi:hypothetical protein XENTR_v10016818 [Xenopus tropicalis]|nr:hypothetical protein XENTR_v10016818 [Xenopus tropicalis]KAE8598413.1 hypothetical protein XENTR_v10016818 [Xenopus tropicalis]